MAEEIKKYQSQARNALNKIKNINIRISDWDYNNIKLRAIQEGLPYQTLVSSLIHTRILHALRENSPSGPSSPRKYGVTRGYHLRDLITQWVIRSTRRLFANALSSLAKSEYCAKTAQYSGYIFQSKR